MDNTVATTNSTGNIPLSPILKTALATVNEAATTTINNDEMKMTNNDDDDDDDDDDDEKCFPEDRVSKDYYFDSYAHL